MLELPAARSQPQVYNSSCQRICICSLCVCRLHSWLADIMKIHRTIQLLQSCPVEHAQLAGICLQVTSTKLPVCHHWSPQCCITAKIQAPSKPQLAVIYLQGKHNQHMLETCYVTGQAATKAPSVTCAHQQSVGSWPSLLVTTPLEIHHIKCSNMYNSIADSTMLRGRSGNEVMSPPADIIKLPVYSPGSQTYMLKKGQQCRCFADQPH